MYDGVDVLRVLTEERQRDALDQANLHRLVRAAAPERRYFRHGRTVRAVVTAYRELTRMEAIFRYRRHPFS